MSNLFLRWKACHRNARLRIIQCSQSTSNFLAGCCGIRMLSMEKMKVCLAIRKVFWHDTRARTATFWLLYHINWHIPVWVLMEFFIMLYFCCYFKLYSFATANRDFLGDYSLVWLLSTASSKPQKMWAYSFLFLCSVFLIISSCHCLLQRAY